MAFNKISPWQILEGIGTYDTFADRKKYRGRKEAILMNDVAVADFVQESGTNDIYIEIYHTKNPNERNMYKLQDQAFFKHYKKVIPEDDQAVAEIARQLLHIHRGKY